MCIFNHKYVLYSIQCVDFDDNEFAKFTGGNTPDPPTVGRATLPIPLPRGVELCKAKPFVQLITPNFKSFKDS